MVTATLTDHHCLSHQHTYMTKAVDKCPPPHWCTVYTVQCAHKLRRPSDDGFQFPLGGLSFRSFCGLNFIFTGWFSNDANCKAIVFKDQAQPLYPSSIYAQQLKIPTSAMLRHKSKPLNESVYNIRRILM